MRHPQERIGIEPADARALWCRSSGYLRVAYERRKTLPMRITATLVVRASTIVELRRRTKRLRQRVKDLGAELRLLRCE